MQISLTFGTLFVPYSCSNCHINQYLGLECLVVSSWLTLDSSLIRCGLLTILPNGILVLSINIFMDHLIMIRVFRFFWLTWKSKWGLYRGEDDFFLSLSAFIIWEPWEELLRIWSPLRALPNFKGYKLMIGVF